MELVHDQPAPTEVHGYSTFTDVEDTELRDRNRIQVLYNIYERHTKDGMTTVGGLMQLQEYLQAIPEDEREPVVSGLGLLVTDVEDMPSC